MAKESPSPSSSSMSSVLRAYAAPIFIFVLAMFFQLFLLPRSFPTSHYDGTISLSTQLSNALYNPIALLIWVSFPFSFGCKDVRFSGWRERGVRGYYCFQMVTLFFFWLNFEFDQFKATQYLCLCSSLLSYKFLFFFEIDRHRNSDSGDARPADFIKVRGYFVCLILSAF